MKEYKYKNLTTITSQKQKDIKNCLKVWMNWDSNDGDYIEKTEQMSPELLFNNKKLIYCLAYITLDYNFKGHNWNDAAFCHHITENCDIDGLEDILSENDFAVYSDWGMCHSCYGLEITYYDEDGKPWNINFNDIHKRWKNMSYEEICNEINNIEDE